MVIQFDSYSTITFDCYGTLVDWEGGMLAALTPLLAKHGVELTDSQILHQFGTYESKLEQGPYLSYREILKGVVKKFGADFGFDPSLNEQDALPDSIKYWQPFPDTIAALKQLKQSLKLAIISNVDDGLFADTAQNLEVEFDYIITAEQVKSYKPSLKNFEYAIDRMGCRADQIIHAAGSIYHDIVPASSLGLTTVWVDRRASQGGSGAAPTAEGQADLVVPDLKTLASLATSSTDG